MTLPGFEFVAECVSDVGRIRTHNEDNSLILQDQGVYIVADGMGGHASGEVASQISVDSLKEFFNSGNHGAWYEKFDKIRRTRKFRNRQLTFEEFWLYKGIEFANRSIFETAQENNEFHDMGTTIVGLLFGDDTVAVSHVGDSRVYRIRERHMEQLTEDHSLVNEYIRLKILDPADSHKFPYKNVIVRALGLNKHVLVDTQSQPLREGDLFLLCSDGLTDMVDDRTILDTVNASQSNVSDACQALVRAANQNGGFDNITVMLVQVRLAGAAARTTTDHVEIAETPQGDDEIAGALTIAAAAEAAITVVAESREPVSSGEDSPPNQRDFEAALELDDLLLDDDDNPDDILAVDAVARLASNPPEERTVETASAKAASTPAGTMVAETPGDDDAGAHEASAALAGVDDSSAQLATEPVLATPGEPRPDEPKIEKKSTALPVAEVITTASVQTPPPEITPELDLESKKSRRDADAEAELESLLDD